MKDELTKDIIDFVLAKYPSRFREPEKARAICEMRLTGAKYVEIGEKFNLSPSRCREYVERVGRFYRIYLKSLPKKKTNYDRIRNMSIDEMARFFDRTSVFMCTTEKAIKEWLESEAKE